MKKTLNTLIYSILVLLIAFPVTVYAAAPTSVNYNFTVNKKAKTMCQGYNIDGDLYFSILDLSSLLAGTDKQFCVSCDSSKKIRITSNKIQSSLNESALSGAATSGTSTIIFDNYNIVIRTYAAQSFFVNIRDILQWIDVNVDVNSTNDKIELDTKEYLLPKARSNPFKGKAEAIDNKYIKDFGKSPGIIHHEADRLYHNGSYYRAGQGRISVFKPVNNQKARDIVLPSTSDYEPSNMYIYGDKIYFETHFGSAATDQNIWSASLNGTGARIIMKNTFVNGQSMTLYKGKIYVCTYGSNGARPITVKRYNLNGIFETEIITDRMAGNNPYRKYSYRAYSIFADKIYYITPDGKLYSVNIDGTKKVNITNLASFGRVFQIACAYDNFVYFVSDNGLFRVGIDGSNPIWLIAKNKKLNFWAHDIAVYGDKITFPDEESRFGVANCDGTGRIAYPNTSYDVTAKKYYYKQVSILNSDYTCCDYKLINNDPLKTGYVKLGYDEGKDYIHAWKQYTTPAVYNAKYKQGGLPDGTYYIRPAKARNLSLGISAASKNNMARVILWDHKDSENRKFIIKSTGKGTYIITPKHSGLQLACSEKMGTAVYQGSACKLEFRKFEIVPEAGNYKIKDENGYYWGVSAGRMANGTEIIIWKKATEGSQDFVFEKAK